MQRAGQKRDRHGGASRCRRWCFTINNPTKEERDAVVAVLMEAACWFAVVGEEVGAAGTPHFQGFVHFRGRKQLTECKKLLSARAHFEVARGSDADNDKYCTKDGHVLLRVGAPCASDADRDTTNRSYRKAREISKRLAGGEDLLHILDGDDDAGNAYLKHARVIQELMAAEREKSHADVVSREFDHVVLRFWQRELLTYLEDDPHPRKIVWYVDERGNSGKTFLSKYLISKKGAVRFENGRSCDIKFAYKGEKIVLFDLSRSQEERFNYEVLESLKNGVMFSSKYASSMRVFCVPHVVVFCNWAPNCEKLSQDRWDVRYIDDEQCRWVHALASDVRVKKERERDAVVVADDYDADDDCVLIE